MKTENIDYFIKKLQLEFYKIQCKNWILSKSNGTGAAGRTFEILLNKKADKLSLPDYQGIEIKTQSEISQYRIGLFSAAFDNKPLEMERLLKIGGYPDKKHPEFNVFHIDVFGNHKKKVGYGNSYQLKVDHKSKVIRLYIYNKYYKLIDNQMSWSFELLQSRLNHKLQYLAYIPVRKWICDGKTYFKYLNLFIYKLKNFDVFLHLVEIGVISVNFKIDYIKSGEFYGQIYNHGATFEIKKEDLDKLFELIDVT